jgi:hypothetical protein
MENSMRTRMIAFAPTIRRLTLAAALLVCLSNNLQAQFNGCPAGFCSPMASGSAPTNNLTIDGTPVANSNGGGTTLTLTFSTTKTNDIIYVCADLYAAHVTTIADSPGGLTWHTIGSATDGSGMVSAYWALASSTLSLDVITITANSTTSIFDGGVIAINGANTSSPLDPNGALPATRTTQGLVTMSTTNSFTVPVACYGNVNPPDAAGSGWTRMGNNTTSPLSTFQYQIASSPLSSVTVPVGSPSTNPYQAIADAVTQ